MPAYVVLRADELPGPDQMVQGLIFRVANAVDELDAVRQAAAKLGEKTTNSVWGVTLQSNITRRTATPSAAPTYTVT
jgi:hypothetical protein